MNRNVVFWLVVRGVFDLIVVFTHYMIGIFGGKNAKKIGTKTDTKEDVPQSSTQEASNVFKVGDIISFDEKEVTLTNVTRNYDTGNSFSKPKDGKEFVKVTVEIINKSKIEISYNNYDFKMKDGNGAIKTPEIETYSLSDSLELGKLSPNGKVKGSMIFEVPKGDQELSLIYKPSFWSNKKIEIKI